MRIVLLVVAGVLIGVIGATGAVLVGLARGGIGAKVEPTRVERLVARKLLRFGIPDRDRHLANPMPTSSETLRAGRAHFADHCAVCHANDGSGQTEIGRNLYPRTPDLRLRDTQELTDGELFYIIENGVRLTGMPAWGDDSEDSKRASWHLVQFIRHLPQLRPEEKLDMERLNPKSPEEWREMQEDERFLRGQEAPRREHHHPH